MTKEERAEVYAKGKEFGLKRKCIESRLKRGWSKEEILTTPSLTRSQAGHYAAKRSPWKKWEPGKYSNHDKEKRKTTPEWRE